jgi:hypothetical protein
MSYEAEGALLPIQLTVLPRASPSSRGIAIGACHANCHANVTAVYGTP